MARGRLIGLLLVFLALLSVGCVVRGSVAQSGLTPTPPTPLPKATPAPALAAQGILAESVQQLNGAESYKFTIAATLRNVFEGKDREWKYTGKGSAAKPNRYQWTLEGSADALFEVVTSGGQLYCADTRGERKDCTLASGGPNPGSSPYTVLSFLRNFDQVGEVTTKALQGADFYHMTFSPSLPKVSSQDAGHNRALANVTSVAGEVWIDKQSRLPQQERVLVKSKSPSTGEETVEMTVVFSDYGKPVDIRMPW